MRLLSEPIQTVIFDELVKGLLNYPEIPFIISKDNFGLIDGRHEAYYAVLASNFIIGRLDTSLKYATLILILHNNYIFNLYICYFYLFIYVYIDL